MSQDETSKDPAWATAVAQASAWIATLHSPRRTPAAERSFQRWLQESPLHQQAFELATETWNEHRNLVRRGAGLKVMLHGEHDDLESRARWWPVVAGFAALAAVVLIVAGGAQYFQLESFETGANEQRMVSLEDDTRVSLNAGSRVEIDYGKRQRLVYLKSGDAVFAVAEESGREFIVVAGDRKVTVTGTVFHVQATGNEVNVALLDGALVVEPDVQGVSHHNLVAQKQELVPGDRFRFTKGQNRGVLERPGVDQLMKQTGMIKMDRETLVEAVEEMNRFNTVQLELNDENLYEIEVSGIFHLGDSRQFAKMVADVNTLQLEDQGDRILLSKTPGDRPAIRNRSSLPD